LILCFLPLALITPLRASEEPPVRNNFGSVGLIDMPSASMAPDGQLSMGASFFKNTQHYTISFQALPWLETDFRYSGLRHFDINFPTFYDRSFALKMRVSREDGIFPAVSFGINDLVGTGVYSGEYVVASKHIGPLEASIGMGWGRLATATTIPNPLGAIFPSFKNRINNTNGVGQFPLKEYFRGPDAGIFGGVVWHTPIRNLALIAEYSSDAYAQESASGNFTPRTQLNLGASYSPFDGAQFALTWMYGREIGINASFQTDPTKDIFSQRIEPPMPNVQIRSAEQQQHSLSQIAYRQASTPALKVDQNVLVDAIWESVAGVTDVAFSGRSILITANRPQRAALCESLAEIVAKYGTNVDRIAIQVDGGKIRNCANTPIVLINGNQSAAASAAAIALIKADARKQLILIDAAYLNGADITVFYENNEYFHEREAVERLTRVLMNDAPLNVETFHIISTITGQPQSEFTILRGATERSINLSGSFSILEDGNGMQAAALGTPTLAASERKTFPRLQWSVFPQFRQQLFDPTNPFAVQFVAAASATLNLSDKFSIQGEVEGNLYDNFNVGRPSDSTLPHVRTDFVRFFTEGKNGIGNLEADYRFHLNPHVTGMLKAGYLESMFAGVGGELLWRPEGQRWAVGADLYEVQERNFDRLLGLQNYRTTTGHLALYYMSPWYGLDFTIMAGRYLAGDEGLTIQLSRRFSTGVELGVFATKTNVSATQFGEGSFDKGFFIRIPLNWTLPIATQNELAMTLRPVQRDGGQRLANDTQLYEITRRSSYGEVLLSTEQ
ncbi:MAG TPA: YjbH domain-containing protein, partial [Tepidisphaeraceae bacterium]|nr:YjbH domain-containing protein [Tepidisphaeraceae bacterium]